jgi:hypothetical protein
VSSSDWWKLAIKHHLFISERHAKDKPFTKFLGEIRSSSQVPQDLIEETLYSWDDYEWHPPMAWHDEKKTCEITEDDIVTIADEKTTVLCR